jgi:hypothetical protein
MFVLRSLPRSFTVHCVAEGQHLILGTAAMLFALLAASLCSALCYRQVSTDPLAQLPMFVCAGPQLQCTVLEVNTPDPLTQLPCLFYASCSVPLRCTVLRSQPLISGTAAHVCFALLAAFLCGALLQSRALLI